MLRTKISVSLSAVIVPLVASTASAVPLALYLAPAVNPDCAVLTPPTVVTEDLDGAVTV